MLCSPRIREGGVLENRASGSAQQGYNRAECPPERRARKEILNMPQYQVTMNLLKAEPLLDLGKLTEIVTEAILPSLRALKDLQSKGKILAGGHPVKQRYIVMIME